MLRLRYLLRALLLLSSAILHAETIIPPGPVSGTWTRSGSPYLIEGQIAIPPDSTLIIEPGVDVIFQWWYIFNVYGYLHAIGAENDSILFTAADSSIGWRGIWFLDAPDSSHFIYCILQYGHAMPPYSNIAGGLRCEYSNPVITHCTFRYNHSEFGGAISCGYSNPTITCCMFYSNTADAGGAIAISDSNPYISHCIFQNNTVTCQAGAIGGEGDVYLEYCDFIGNYAEEGAGAIALGSGSTILNCSFVNNHSRFPGSAAIISDSLFMANCVFSSNSATYQGSVIRIVYSDAVIIMNCVVTNNSGSAISIEGGSPSISYCVIDSNLHGGIDIDEHGEPTIDQCTITKNGEFGIDLRHYYSSFIRYPTIRNTIIEGNYGDVGGICASHTLHPLVEYCDVVNNLPANFTGAVPDSLGELVTVNANGDSCDIYFNIQLDPLFVNPLNRDFHLQSASPCIDAGDPLSPLDPDSTITDIGAFYFNQLWVRDPLKSPAPSEFRLFQNYPNPFNANTVISYLLPHPTKVTLSIYNIIGQRVETLFDDIKPPGHHQAIWRATNTASGVYIAQLRSNSQVQNIKILLLK